MITQALDNNGDWSFSFKTGNEAIKQNIETKVREWKQDCYFNQTAGIDWKNRLTKGSSYIKTLLDAELKQLISNCQGVASVSVAESIYDNEKNKLTIKFNVILTNNSTLEGVINDII